MMQELFKNWFFKDFVPAVKNSLKKLKMHETVGKVGQTVPWSTLILFI